MQAPCSIRSICGLILMTAIACAIPAARTSADEAPALPDTPAGKRFAAWLAAVNSGDRDGLQRFVADNFAPPPRGTLPVDRFVARYFALYSESQGFVLQKVIRSTDDRIAVVLEAKRTGYSTQVGMAVIPMPPNKILGLSFSGTEAPADTLPHTPLTDKEIVDRIDALINTLVAADQFSGVILVSRDDKPIYSRVVGLASRAWNMPNRLDTRFNIASIGKMFTGVAVAQLAEDGKLSYDETLDKALPQYPGHALAAKVTIGQLLTHSSGITSPNYGSASNSRKDLKTVSDLLPTSAVDTLKFEPGSKAEYSNYGYRLLGAVIEKASGQDYYSYIREHIYKPAGMNNTDSYELDTDPPNLATGYMDAPSGARRSNIFYLPNKGLPEGLGYSTAEDLVKFGLALRGHRLLSATSLDAVWTGRVDFDRGKYGYGFNVRQYNGARIVGHGGGWVGITDQFDMLPDLGYTIVILNNIDSAPDPIAYKLHEWLTQGR